MQRPQSRYLFIPGDIDEIEGMPQHPCLYDVIENDVQAPEQGRPPHVIHIGVYPGIPALYDLEEMVSGIDGEGVEATSTVRCPSLSHGLDEVI